MTKPSQADIDTILNERFPTRHLFEAAALIEGFKKPDGSAMVPLKPTDPSPSAKKAELDRYRAHLEALPALQVAELAAQSRQRLAAQAAAERARKEAARFYNQPSARADFEFWCKADYWTADEAAALLLGRDPRVVNPASLNAELTKATGLFSLGKPPAPADFHRQYDGLRTLLPRASGLQGSALTPQAAVEWATRTKSVSIPPALVAALASSAGTAATLQDGARSMGNAPAQVDGTQAKWTPDMLEALRKFKEQHGATAAAKNFGISRPRVYQLLPKEQASPQMAGPFDVLTKRLK